MRLGSEHRPCPGARCGTSAAPVAADTIGGTTGISQPPNAASPATSWPVITRYGIHPAVTRPSAVPADHSAVSTPSAARAPIQSCPSDSVPAHERTV